MKKLVKLIIGLAVIMWAYKKYKAMPQLPDEANQDSQEIILQKLKDESIVASVNV